MLFFMTLFQVVWYHCFSVLFMYQNLQGKKVKGCTSVVRKHNGQKTPATTKADKSSLIRSLNSMDDANHKTERVRNPSGPKLSANPRSAAILSKSMGTFALKMNCFGLKTGSKRLKMTRWKTRAIFEKASFI